MTEDSRERTKLINRVSAFAGRWRPSSARSQMATDECAEVLMLLAAVRGGINGLMAEVLEDHIRLHLLQADALP